MNLSKAEQNIFEFLNGGSEHTLDEIMMCVNSNNRGSMVVRLKYLAAKIAKDGWVIENSGGIGRGKKAQYRMFKKGE